LPKLEIEIRGQFANFKNLEEPNYNFWKNWGVTLQFFGNILGSICNIWKI